MRRLPELFERNREWARRTVEANPKAFESLASQQRPEYLWIGCSDSRVPANQIVDLPPGEVFVHRNVANVVAHADMNLLSVLEYAVEILQIRHVIVCGHYGCGGIQAAIEPARPGLLVDNWLRHVRDVKHKHRQQLEGLPEQARVRKLAELNTVHQARNVCHTSIVQNAWSKGRELSVHAWIYGVEDGLLHDLGFTVDGFDQVDENYRVSTSKVS